MAAFIGFIKDYWGVIVGISGFFFGWVKFTAAKTYALKDDLRKIEKRLDVLEQGYKNVASKDDIHKISIQVERLTGEMGEPTFKTFKFRQTEWKHILETVCFYAIYSRLEKTGNIPEDLRNYRPVAQFPELTHRDTSVYAAALQQTVVAVGIAVEKSMMTEETAVAVIGSMISRIGIEVNPAKELEQARAKARIQTQDDIYDEQDV